MGWVVDGSGGGGREGAVAVEEEVVDCSMYVVIGSVSRGTSSGEEGRGDV